MLPVVEKISTEMPGGITDVRVSALVTIMSMDPEHVNFWSIFCEIEINPGSTRRQEQCRENFILTTSRYRRFKSSTLSIACHSCWKLAERAEVGEA